MKRAANYTKAQNAKDAQGLADTLYTLATLKKPTVARVHGNAYAGGMGFVAACDMAIASTEAVFCISEAKLGLTPATISPYVIRAMGARTAHRYFLTAERFTAQEAHRMGMVHEVTTAEALDAKVAELTHALVNASPHAVRACKKLVQDVAEHKINDALVAKTVAGIADIRAVGVLRCGPIGPIDGTGAQLTVGLCGKQLCGGEFIAADADQGNIVGPGAWLTLYDPTGVPVTAGTGDLLTITTSAVVGATNAWDILILGRSA
jgi:hypothetical protein